MQLYFQTYKTVNQYDRRLFRAICTLLKIGGKFLEVFGSFFRTTVLWSHDSCITLQQTKAIQGRTQQITPLPNHYLKNRQFPPGLLHKARIEVSPN
ncbi:MAG TPA: hypothetical protein DDZ04_02405 [Parabacteroides sp.]|nr:hypothetical protein [Parabacteroides sp.]